MNEDLYFFIMDFFQYLLNGLIQGSIYALIALGYTMVYGIIKLINFAHGEFYMIGAFAGLMAMNFLHLPPFLILPVAMVCAGILAVLVEKMVYRPLRGQSRITALITALGVSLFLQYFGQMTLGAAPRPYPQFITNETYFFYDLMITKVQIIIVATMIALMCFLWWLVNHTKLGKAMRATSFNHDAAALMGVNIDVVISFTFFLGAALAGAAGVLVGMYYNTVDPMMGMIPGLKAFVAAVLGGIGSIPGAVLGGLVLGVAENMVVGFWESTFRDAIAFAILILILLFKPTGLLGKNVKEKV